jgi:hypothetical protein
MRDSGRDLMTHSPSHAFALAAEAGIPLLHLGRLVRDGVIPNAGRERSPRILRRDLPRKPKPPDPPQLATGTSGGPSLARIPRDAITTRTRRRE